MPSNHHLYSVRLLLPLLLLLFTLLILLNTSILQQVAIKKVKIEKISNAIDATTTAETVMPTVIIFWWESSNNVDRALARIMHAAVKSAALAGVPETSIQEQQQMLSKNQDRRRANVIVFSNSLPSTFFCGGSPPHTFQNTFEQNRTLAITCDHVRVQTYHIGELLKGHPTSVIHSIQSLTNGADSDDKIGNKIGNKIDDKTDNKTALLLPNDLSDLFRFLLLYKYGGTYMDMDQMMLRPLPRMSPLLVQERQWSKKGCLSKRPNNYCKYIPNPIPATCLNPAFSNDHVLSLYSGVLGNFPIKSKMMGELVAEASRSLNKSCPLGWGCLGPVLVTRVFSEWCRTHDNSPPAWVLPNSMYLLQKAQWKIKKNYDSKIWRKTRVSVLDIDFHGKKRRGAMIAGLVDRMLWWSGSKMTSRSMADLDEREYDKYVEKQRIHRLKSGESESLSNVDSSNSVKKLPWERL